MHATSLTPFIMPKKPHGGHISNKKTGFDFLLPMVSPIIETSPHTETWAVLKVFRMKFPIFPKPELCQMPGYFTELSCSVWFMLAVITNNTNQDQAVHEMAVQHQHGLELCSHWEAWPVKQPHHSFLFPLSHIPKLQNAPVILLWEGRLGSSARLSQLKLCFRHHCWDKRWWDLI